jgi:hypothetical protein
MFSRAKYLTERKRIPHEYARLLSNKINATTDHLAAHHIAIRQESVATVSEVLEPNTHDLKKRFCKNSVHVHHAEAFAGASGQSHPFPTFL